MMPTTFIDLFFSEWPVFIIKLWEQFYMVIITMLLVIIIGLPLGIIIKHFKKTRTIILGLSAALWTIPSLALLAFFIPFLGIGFKPALLTLCIYAILPILSNTVTGLENVPAANIEAAKALGFTRLQQLWIVELPMALPIIIAGIRTSLTISISVATLASFVGAGGLGDFITQGLALNNANLILLGAIPAALMALIFDYIIACIEKWLATPHTKKNISRLSKISYRLLYIFIIFAIGFSIYINYKENSHSVRIASKNFSEQIILGELISVLIEAKTDLHVIRKFNLGTTAICQAAILNDEIDIYLEYTGTAYLTVLKSLDLTIKDIFTNVKNRYKSQFNLIWLKPFGFNNTQALVVRDTFAKQYNLHTISDLKSIENQLVIGVPAEFLQREDGLTGLSRVYHLNFGKIRQMEPGLMYKALQKDGVNLINAFSTDARIMAYNLTLLADDKHFYPTYYAAPVIRANVLQKHPEIEQVLAPLLGIIDDETMQKLNYQVEINHRTPYVVALQFLRAKKLIQ